MVVFVIVHLMMAIMVNCVRIPRVLEKVNHVVVMGIVTRQQENVHVIQAGLVKDVSSLIVMVFSATVAWLIQKRCLVAYRVHTR